MEILTAATTGATRLPCVAVIHKGSLDAISLEVYSLSVTLNKTLGRALRDRRRKVDLSQSKVATLTGKTQSQIARLENGLGDPRFSR